MSPPDAMFDERFLTHRLHATSIASMAGAGLAGGLLLYHYWTRHTWSWELFAIILTMAIVKQVLMLWFRFTR